MSMMDERFDDLRNEALDEERVEEIDPALESLLDDERNAALEERINDGSRYIFEESDLDIEFAKKNYDKFQALEQSMRNEELLKKEKDVEDYKERLDEAKEKMEDIRDHIKATNRVVSQTFPDYEEEGTLLNEAISRTDDMIDKLSEERAKVDKEKAEKEERDKKDEKDREKISKSYYSSKDMDRAADKISKGR